jgi:DEAD/DEAH box helicase domain-containing protein
MPGPFLAGTVIFDLETQRLFEEVGGRFPERLGLAVAVTWDNENGFREWWERDAQALVAELSRFRRVVGFNVLRFDYEVLSPYQPDVFRLLSGKTVDVLEDVFTTLGFRVKLTHLAEATLGRSKTADGIEAVRLWRDGERQKLVEYCRADVELTRDLYAHGLTRGEIFYPSHGLKCSVPAHWRS